MAVFEYSQSMYDIRLKPRFLRSLIKDHLPDENHPFPGPLELLSMVSSIKTHGLLSESVSDPVDQKLIDKWKSAIDAWVERLLLLISSKMPDKCWAGICLLGLTCQECSASRFLDSYSAWFQKLLPQIQQPSDSQFVKVASCASLSDMFTRLSGILSVKKDGTSLAEKLIQPILKLLTEDSSESVWEGAVDLFCTLINFFPSSVHRHYDSAEAVIVSKIMSQKCNASMSKKFAHCLALLPKTKGDEDSWSLMMQKVLIYINVQLNDAFQGLEEDSKYSDAMRLLVQPGKDPPPPLGGQVSGEVSNHATQRSEQLLFYRVSTLMQCCSMMLTNSYPVQVSVPVRPLLALVRRVLSVDGSSSQALIPFMTIMQQENICSELPILHLYSLDLLTAIIKGLRSQLLPNAAEVVRFITEYFRRCALPALRIKVYSIMQILLISMGVGMALYLAQEVINNAFVDLDSFSRGNGVTYTYLKPATYALQQPSNKKRKHGTITGSNSDHQNGVGLEVDITTSKSLAPISVQIAALQALEALLTVGGALRSECWRSNVDLLLITVATNACDKGWANEARIASTVSGEHSSTWADFQLAALRALLASFLSPARCRPQYLSQGLELFRRGKQETGTKLAELCAHALLALEVLIHPRALPLADFSFSNCGSFNEGFNHKFPENPFSSAQKLDTPFSRGVLGKDDPDPDDELYESWLGNGEEVDAPVCNTDKNMEHSDKLSEEHVQQTNGDQMAEKIAVDDPVSTLVVREGRSNDPTSSINVETGRFTDDFMVTAERSQVPIAFNDVGTSDKGVTVSAVRSANNERESIVGVTDRNILDTSKDVVTLFSALTNTEAASNKGAMFATGDVAAPDKLPLGSTISVSGKGKEFRFEDDSDLDSFPDIIDGDPDTD